MTVLILGLLLFLGLHSVRIVADGWRSAQLARVGEKRWKGLYSPVAFAGLGLIILDSCAIEVGHAKHEHMSYVSR